MPLDDTVACPRLELYAWFWSFSLQKDRAEIAKNEVNLKLGDEKLFKDFDTERDLKTLGLYHLGKWLTGSMIRGYLSNSKLYEKETEFYFVFLHITKLRDVLELEEL